MPETAPRHRDDCITLSEADPFTLTGLVLFGARWKAPLARTLGVSRETVSRWVSSGDIPKWARNTVALLNAGKGSVLSLCDRTGNMVRPWAEAGFECFCVDVRHEPSQTRRGAVTWIGADIREWLPPPRRYAIGRMLEHTMEGKMPSSSAAKSYLPPGLHQTNVRGVYAFGSAPAGFDPKSAKRDELIRNGFPPRPGRRSPPSHLAAWKRMFEVPERTFRRVAGDLTPGRRVMSPTGPIDNQTQAWSGIVVESSPGGPVQGCNSVWGTLQMPGGVTSSTLETSLGVIICLCSAWVGLDGWNYVEGAPPATGPCQTGVDILLAGFPGNQNTSYKGWIEWNMDSKLNATSPYLQPYYVPVDVNANDVISLWVYYIDWSLASVLFGPQIGPPGLYANLQFFNETTGDAVGYVISMPDIPAGTEYQPTGQTLEWVVESPGGGEYFPPNFGTLTFSAVGGCVTPLVDNFWSEPNIGNAENVIMQIQYTAANGQTVSGNFVSASANETASTITFKYIGQ